jgi:transcription initiation factor TFIIIB Brf1 subunit/transcription initiation factor TFIIB
MRPDWIAAANMLAETAGLELDYKIPVVDLTKCIAKVANKTNLSEKTKRKAIDIMNDITTNNEIFSDGKNPMGVAATNFTYHARRLVKK